MSFTICYTKEMTLFKIYSDFIIKKESMNAIIFRTELFLDNFTIICDILLGYLGVNEIKVKN
jgi:hypothetical protein